MGPVAAWRNGCVLDLGAPQQLACLALLLLHRNEVVSTDRFIDVLWPSRPPRTALQVVRTYVFRLRGKLATQAGPSPDPILLTHAQGYELHLEPEEVDADRFEALVPAGRSALEGGDGIRAESLLREALGLVRGPALPELPDDDFARYERHRLAELSLVAQEELVEARLAQGRHRELVPELRAAVAAQPLRERAWGQLMVALYRSGRQADALAAYRDARRVLDEELGIEPGPAIRSVERMILLQDEALLGPPARERRLPVYATSFVGRESEVEETLDTLRRGRLVALVGPAGAGKSRLAAEVASTLRHSLGPRLWWVDLGSVPAGRAVAAVAAALDVPELPGRTPADLVVSRLGDEPGLLVLDNCEHALEEVAALATRVLRGTARARLLCTSRETLRAAGELVRPVAGLPVPPEAPAGAEELTAWPSARLFVERAAAARPGFGLRDDDAPAVAELLARLDGLPLAIELAAALLRSLSPAELARGLRIRPLGLGEGDRTAPLRQRSLDSAIGWSCDLLSPHDRTLLSRISVFPQSFDLAAAEAVMPAELAAGAVRDGLTRLVHASLLDAEPRSDRTRYRLLQTVRAFAVAAAGAEERADAARRHRDFFSALAEDVFVNMVGPGLPVWLSRAREEHESLRAALVWSLDRGDGEPALKLAAALARYWFRTGLVVDGRQLLGRALETARPGGVWWARALLEAARLAHAAGDPDRIGAARKAVAACEVEGDRECVAFGLSLLAENLAEAGEHDQAHAALGRARELFDASDSDEGLAHVDQILGNLLFFQRDLDGAEATLSRARDRMRRIRGRLDAGWILVELAGVLIAQGRPAEAIEPATQAVADFRRRGDARGLAGAFVSLGRAHALSGDAERGRALLSEALELSTRWGYAAQADAAALARTELSLA